MKFKVTTKELNPKQVPLAGGKLDNFCQLFFKINVIRNLYDSPMIVTSGLRSVEDQKRINPKAMKSLHLRGAACDIADPKGELFNWLIENTWLLEMLDIYLEDRSATPRHVHIQVFPPRSGKRVFLP